MNMNWNITTVILTFLTHAFAVSASPMSTGPNVILITLDGVRWDEVFKGTDPELTGAPSEVIMTHLNGDLANQGLLLGDRKQSFVQVSNRCNLSLPGYQSIFTGHPTSCGSNFCSRVRNETFPEALQSKFNFSPVEIAGFASWSRIRRAYSRRHSELYLNAGLNSSELEGANHQDLDTLQSQDIPHWNRPHVWSSRYDRYTFAHGFAFLKENHPRFLYIGLLDSDEYAHAGNYPAYVETLRTYDLWIREVVDYLDSSGEYGRNTLLIVTTDHGRGQGGDRWEDHGRKFPESNQIFLYLRGLGIKPGIEVIPGFTLTHDFIRNLIEATFSGAQANSLLSLD
jgi:hypothetical protein